MGEVRPRFLGFTPDGRRRYACDYDLLPIAGGADPSSDDQVDTGSDDGMQIEGSGGMYITQSYGDVYSHTSATFREWMAFRFHNGPFPSQGSTVDVAYIEIYLPGADFDDANFDIYVHDAAEPPTLTADLFDITDRPRTDASAAWVQDALGTGWKQSPPLASVIQEVVTDYAATAIMVIFQPRTNVSKICRIRTFEHATDPPAKLHLEWTEAGVDEFGAAAGEAMGAMHIQRARVVSY